VQKAQLYLLRRATVFCKSVIPGLLVTVFTHSSSVGVHSRSEELSINKIGVIGYVTQFYSTDIQQNFSTYLTWSCQKAAVTMHSYVVRHTFFHAVVLGVLLVVL
jgi:hypothetical protein